MHKGALTESGEIKTGYVFGWEKYSSPSMQETGGGEINLRQVCRPFHL